MNFSPQTKAWMRSHSQTLCHLQTRRLRTEDADAEGKVPRQTAAALQTTGPRPLVPAHHLLLLQQNLGLDGQDQIRGGVSQLAHVLVDVAVALRRDDFVHVPGRNVLLEVVAGR